MRSHRFRLRPVPPFDLRLTSLVLQRSPANRIDHPAGAAAAPAPAAAAAPYRRLLDLRRAGALVLAEVRQLGSLEAPELDVSLVGVFDDAEAAEREARRALTLLLGLDVDLSGFHRLAQEDRRLAQLVQRLRGLKPQRFPELFEAMLNCICCQQVSLHAGLTSFGRAAEAFGPRLEVHGRVYVAPPRPETVAALEPDALRACGFSRQRAAYAVGAARALLNGDLDPDRLARLPAEQAMAALTALRGFGRWSAHYILLRGLGRLDVFPIDDVGASRSLARWLGLGDHRLPPDQVDAITSAWGRYRGLLYFYLLGWRRTAGATPPA